jgi:hypothetical protein
MSDLLTNEGFRSERLSPIRNYSEMITEKRFLRTCAEKESHVDCTSARVKTEPRCLLGSRGGRYGDPTRELPITIETLCGLTSAYSQT